MPRFVVEGVVSFSVPVEVEVEAEDEDEAAAVAVRHGLLESAAVDLIDQADFDVDVYDVYEI